MRKRLLKNVSAFFASVTAIFLLTSTMTLTDNAAVSAAPGDGFDAGYIISDQLFYDGKSMTAGQVQQFLESKIDNGGCTINNPRFPERKAGASWGSHYKINSHCLTNMTIKTPSKPADAYCKAYKGKSSESAAQIISNVGKACGVSPKVLLVKLQKEQSLVTDSWPTTRQVDVAMGFNCPDTGVGGTANCKPESFGFFNQVYSAARQSVAYRDNPYFGWYPLGVPLNIKHGVSASCGTKKVTIENHATAGLYYYTPYTPNNNALKGNIVDRCALDGVGNLNFFNMYKNWFGSPNTKFPVHTTMLNYWNANKTKLGEPTAKAIAGGGGYSQKFQKGTLFSNSKKEVILFDSRFEAAWNKGGAAKNPSGVPKGNVKAVAGGHMLELTQGTMYRSSAGTFTLKNGNLLTEYKALGGPGGSWGWPQTDLYCDTTGNECFAEFQKGSAVWTKLRGSKFTPHRSLAVPAEDPNAKNNMVGGGL